MSPSERYINTAALDAILARIVQTALADYRCKRYCPGKPSAAAFLIAAGIVNPETGAIDWHGYRRWSTVAAAHGPRREDTT